MISPKFPHRTAQLLLCGLMPVMLAADPYRQDAEVAPSQSPDKPPEQTTQPKRDLLTSGPKPEWIWGDSTEQNYLLRADFDGGASAAWLIATCDNIMSVSINGQTVATSSEWQQPVRVEVTKHLKPGKNELVAEVRNQGGPAGFVLKLALVMPDQSVRYVITDENWTAALNKDAEQLPVKKFGKLGVRPWGDVFAQGNLNQSSNRGIFNLPPGFQVEKLFTVPRDELGSWVCLVTGPDGKLYASDQGGKGICRITPASLDGKTPTIVEKLPLKISAAQGMLFAFGNFYLSINGGPGSGLYRAKDTNGDGEFDTVEKLKDFRGGGEHGPHALRLSPDGKSIFVICGNHTDPPQDLDHSRLPKNWGEDLLLPRMWDANGHARGRMAPGGWIAKTDPDGKTWEIWSAGYRNAYDMAFNADGELFTYDADMEWDMGTPWYRPTRLVHATSGSEFGWRSGTGKWPTYYPDSLPPVVDIGPGSPVGVEFGYGTKFPAKYQKALYLLDWTFGTIYAVHLKPEGSTYTGEKTEFLSRTPLPLTDATVGADGALYFAIGGRGTQSELYRVTYVGDEPTEPVDGQDQGESLNRRVQRLMAEVHESSKDFETSKYSIPRTITDLGSADRFLRYAARITLEHQPVEQWASKVLAIDQPQALINGALALARQGKPEHQPQLLEALGRLDFAKLTHEQKLELLRAYALTFIRLGEPDDAARRQLVAKLDAHYPADDDSLNRELCDLLVYLRSPTVVSKTLELMKQPSNSTEDELSDLLARNPGYGTAISRMLQNPPDIQKVHYAFALRNVKFGWTLEQRKEYFDWFADARTKSGGNSYRGFLDNARKEAWEAMTDAERKALESSVTVVVKAEELPKPIGPGKEWKLPELLKLTEGGLRERNYENGQRAFASARCIVCHRFAGEGGATGPDLTNAAGRFGYREMFEAIVLPSKDISDQYRATVVTTLDGQTITGRLVGKDNGKVVMLTDPEDPTKVAEIPEDTIDEMIPSPTSLMPEGLINPLNRDEILDMLAYVLSRGDSNDPMFGESKGGP